MSAFEDFVNTELPLRPALIHGNGSPRVSTPPSVVGTIYREQDADPERFWIRIGTASTDWIPINISQTHFVATKDGPYTTIQSAINDAEAVASLSAQQAVLVGPGTWTENITIPRFVYVIGSGVSNRAATTTLVGKVTVEDFGAYVDPLAQADYRGLLGINVQPSVSGDPCVYMRSHDTSAPGLLAFRCQFVKTSKNTCIDAAIADIATAYPPVLQLVDCQVLQSAGGLASQPAIKADDTIVLLYGSEVNVNPWVSVGVSVENLTTSGWSQGYFTIDGSVVIGDVIFRAVTYGEGKRAWINSVNFTPGVTVEAGSVFYSYQACMIAAWFGGSYDIGGAGTVWFDGVCGYNGKSISRVDPLTTLTPMEGLTAFEPSFSADWLATQIVVGAALDELGRRAIRGGAWASRPTTQLFDGRPYYDTTLRKPFWYHVGTALWYDATGTPHP